MFHDLSMNELRALEEKLHSARERTRVVHGYGHLNYDLNELWDETYDELVYRNCPDWD
jgi:hypothetical protein